MVTPSDVKLLILGTCDQCYLSTFQLVLSRQSYYLRFFRTTLRTEANSLYTSLQHPDMSGVVYREATHEDDNTVAEFFVKMWLDIGVPQDCLDPKQIQQTLDFIEESRSYDLKIYMAEKDGKAIGSASGHLFHGLYPDVINKKRSDTWPQISVMTTRTVSTQKVLALPCRKIGYIWGVWVNADHRKQVHCFAGFCLS